MSRGPGLLQGLNCAAGVPPLPAALCGLQRSLHRQRPSRCLLTLHHQLAIHRTMLAAPTRPAALYGGTVIIFFHEGSTLRLLGLMTLATSAIWICFYSLYSRMVLFRAALILPLVAVVRLVGGRSVCRRQLSVLSTAGIAEPPLAAVHNALGWAQ